MARCTCLVLGACMCCICVLVALMVLAGVIFFASLPAHSVNLPIFHLARSSGWRGLGVFVEARIGEHAEDSQYVTLLLDSGSSALGVIGKNTKGKPGALSQCSVSEFHNYYSRSHCALGSYDVNVSTSVKLWPPPDSKYCQHLHRLPEGRDICVTKMNYGGNHTSPGSGFTALPVVDKLAFGGRSSEVAFNAIEYMFGPFQEPPSSGIMGLSTKYLNCGNWSDADTCYPGAMDRFLSEQRLANKLGFCLGKPPLPDGISGNISYGKPGILTLGGSDTALYSGGMSHTELVHDTLQHEAFFSVSLLGVGVNGALASDKSLVTMVDTGQPAGLVLPSAEFKKLHDMAESQSCRVDTDCILDVKLQGVCLKVTNLLTCDIETLRCVAPNPNNFWAFQIGEDDRATIGYDLLKDMYLELDRQNHQLGFAARSDKPCDVRCSDVLGEATCSFTEGCVWDGSHCTGGMSVNGSTSRGSTVVPENQCFPVTASESPRRNLRLARAPLV